MGFEKHITQDTIACNVSPLRYAMFYLGNYIVTIDMQSMKQIQEM